MSNGRSLMPAYPSQSAQKKTARRQGATAASQQRIDQQIWLLHQAMATKLLQQPALATMIRLRLDNWQQQGQIRHGAYLFWNCLLDLLPEPERFCAELLSWELQICKYRRRTPLLGLLSETERQAALQQSSSVVTPAKA
jgi:hypothetical protein